MIACKLYAIITVKKNTVAFLVGHVAVFLFPFSSSICCHPFHLFLLVCLFFVFLLVCCCLFMFFFALRAFHLSNQAIKTTAVAHKHPLSVIAPKTRHSIQFEATTHTVYRDTYIHSYIHSSCINIYIHNMIFHSAQLRFAHPTLSYSLSFASLVVCPSGRSSVYLLACIYFCLLLKIIPPLLFNIFSVLCRFILRHPLLSRRLNVCFLLNGVQISQLSCLVSWPTRCSFIVYCTITKLSAF